MPLAEGDVRFFDPWGNVTSSPGFLAGAQGGAKQAYVGSLGHRKDDETGLIYMRARYYDPQVGRFTSEDPAMQGGNWFAYCANDPVNKVDSDGKVADWLASLIFAVSGASAAAAAALITFFAVTAFLRVEFPGYNPSVDLIALMIGPASAALQSLVTNPVQIGTWMRDPTWANIRASSFKNAGYGAALGAMAGAYNARATFELWYIDNFETVPW